MPRSILTLIVGLTLISCETQDVITLQGVWQLAYVNYEYPDSTSLHHFDELLIYTDGYYLNHQMRINDTLWVNSHGGRYKVLGDSLFLYRTHANISSIRKRHTAKLSYSLLGDTLKTRIRAADPAISYKTWVYHRLE